MRETVNTHEKQDNIYIRWYRFLSRFHRPERNYWHELKKYGYSMENSQEPGVYLWRIVNALGEPVTEWERIVSTDDVIAARERFAEKELEEIRKVEQ